MVEMLNYSSYVILTCCNSLRQDLELKHEWSSFLDVGIMKVEIFPSFESLLKV